MKFVVAIVMCYLAYVSAKPQMNIGFQYLDEAIKQAQSEGKFENQYTILSVSVLFLKPLLVTNQKRNSFLNRWTPVEKFMRDKTSQLPKKSISNRFWRLMASQVWLSVNYNHESTNITQDDDNCDDI